MMPNPELWRALARVSQMRGWEFGTMTFRGYVGRFLPTLRRVRIGSNCLYC